MIKLLFSEVCLKSFCSVLFVLFARTLWMPKQKTMRMYISWTMWSIRTVPTNPWDSAQQILIKLDDQHLSMFANLALESRLKMYKNGAAMMSMTTPVACMKRRQAQTGLSQNYTYNGLQVVVFEAAWKIGLKNVHDKTISKKVCDFPHLVCCTETGGSPPPGVECLTVFEETIIDKLSLFYRIIL